MNWVAWKYFCSSTGSRNAICVTRELSASDCFAYHRLFASFCSVAMLWTSLTMLRQQHLYISCLSFLVPKLLCSTLAKAPTNCTVDTYLHKKYETELKEKHNLQA